MNPYHAQHLPQQPPRPPPPPPLGGGGGFRGGANSNNNSGGGGSSSSAIGFGNTNSRHQRGGPPPSSSSAPSRGVVFFSIRPGEHPATVNGPRGKIAVDFNGGAMTDVVLDQIAEMHGISRSKFTVTATDPSRGSDILKPTDRLLNYDRITVFVIAADISGGGGDSAGGGGMVGNSSNNSGSNSGAAGGGGLPLLSGGGGGNNNSSGSHNNNNISGRSNGSRNGGITVVDDDVFESFTSARINSVVVSDRIVSSAKVAREDGTSTIAPMSLDREVELTGLDLPLNLSRNERPEEEAVTGSGPICTLCSYPVVPAATQQEYTFTSPDSLQTHCCLRFACEQCCRYAVDVLGSPSDKCPICAGLTDEALAKSILSQQAAAAANNSTSSAFIKFDGGIVKGEGGTATHTTINTAVDIGVKRERCDEEQQVHNDSNHGHPMTSVKQEQDGGHQTVAGGGCDQQQEDSSSSCVVALATNENVESDDDDDDDLLDGGGTLMF